MITSRDIPPPGANAPEDGRRSAGFAGLGVAEYRASNHALMLRSFRAGALLLVTYQCLYLYLDGIKPSDPRSALLLLDLGSVAFGLLAFLLTWGGWFVDHWRASAFLVCVAEMAATLAAVSARPEPLRLVLTAVLISIGAASLLPWEWYWQQSFNLICLGAVAAQALWISPANPYRTEHWLAILAAAAIGQFATMFNTIHRREMLSTVEKIDAVQAQLESEAVERVRVESALKRSEELFRSLVENAMDLVAVLTIDGIMLFQSPSLERLTGYKPEEVLNTCAFESIHPDDLPAVRTALAGSLEQTGSVQMARFRVKHKNGSWVFFEGSGRGLPGEPGRVLVNAREVTERVNLEAQLIAARDQALEADRMKSAVLANVSHEVRTPLNIILGYTEHLEQRLAASGETAYRAELESIDRAGKRLLATIRGILDLSRIEAHAFELNPVAVQLAPMLERLIAEFRVLAEQKGLALSCVIDEHQAAVRFDEYCLSHALSNLLQNAINYTAAGRVEARLYRDGLGCLCIDVSDTGVGISEEYMPRLFEPFSREAGAKRGSQGTGLGLTLTRRYLEVNDSSLSVISAKGRGTVFTIHFAHKSESDARSDEQSAA